jgi:hypothetical protein
LAWLPHLSYLTLTLYLSPFSTLDHHPIFHWPGSLIYPISLSHYTSLSLLLWTTIPSAIGLALSSILSHSHTIPLSLFYFRPPIHLPLAQFLAYRHSFPIGQISPLDSYITSDPFALGSLIALMMEAAHTSETSVDIQLRT